MKLLCIFLSLLISMGCQSNKSKSEFYVAPTESAKAVGVAQIPENTVAQYDDQPYPMSAEDDFVDYNQALFVGGEGQAALAAASFWGAAIILSKVINGNPSRTDLRGSCTYGNQKDQIGRSPCNNVKVNLMDDSGSVVVSTTTIHNGNFKFFIPDGKKYFVNVIDRKGRNAKSNVKLTRGQDIYLVIKP